MLENDLELVVEYPNMISGKYAFRLYKSRFSPDDLDKPVSEWRYHFGFPKVVVPKEIQSLLCSTPFWGKNPWKEDEEFILWYTHITSKTEEDPPWKELNRELNFKLKSYNDVIAFIKKGAR